ncbi:MAG: hypothetical protein PHE55_16040 [Methylococcaceae bacterium]|nr:hypothetical protein [Methylococcaceae bacterium]
MQSIQLSGVGSIIHLPADVHPAVDNGGMNGQILNDVEATGGNSMR